MLVELGILAAFLISNKTKGVLMNPNYDELYKKYAAMNGLDWKMLKAISIIESSEGQAASVKYGLNNPKDAVKSVSFDGKSWGLMQMTLPTALDYDSKASVELLNNAEYSIKLASLHLKYLSKLFPTSARKTEWIVKSYNQGQGNTYKERDGVIIGYAADYWRKYLNAYNGIEGI